MKSEDIMNYIKNLEEEKVNLEKKVKHLECDNKNLEQCYAEVQERLKKTLTSIVKNAKEGLNPESKEK